jgi:hypothetical protein
MALFDTRPICRHSPQCPLRVTRAVVSGTVHSAQLLPLSPRARTASVSHLGSPPRGRPRNKQASDCHAPPRRARKSPTRSSGEPPPPSTTHHNSVVIHRSHTLSYCDRHILIITNISVCPFVPLNNNSNNITNFARSRSYKTQTTKNTFDAASRI